MSQKNMQIMTTTSRLSTANHLDHWLARWAINREGHRVQPGLYALAEPGPLSPVFVTANYTLSFDALRSALAGQDAYILVLDTKGINVWCAAGKGTFGTVELVQRIESTRLANVVNHRKLILPQLGAPGIAAYEVKKQSGFTVEYGPVRTDDLPAYLKAGKATAEMRQVRFTLWDRITLIPVELVYVFFPWLLAAILLRSVPTIVALLAGVVLFPILMPWLPTHNFSTKGWILGVLAALPFAGQLFLYGTADSQALPHNAWLNAAWASAMLLTLPPVTAFIALNFTGSTTFTSRTAVRQEIFHFIPPMAWSFGIGLVLMIALFLFKLRG